MDKNQELVVKEGSQVLATAEAGQEVSPIIQTAIERGADPDQLAKLWELQLQYEANEAKKAFNAAIAQFKANPPQIFKSKEVDFTSRRTGQRTHYKHATIDQVNEIVTPALSAYGLSHRWDVEQANNVIRVSCIISHVLGHSEGVTMEGPRDDSGMKNAIQQVGSTATYLQRYTLLMALGLAAKDMPVDDDGALSPGVGGLTGHGETISEEEINKIDAFLTEHELDAGVFKKWLSSIGYETYADIEVRQLKRIWQALRQSEERHRANQ